jgi:hypothetical protein
MIGIKVATKDDFDQGFELIKKYHSQSPYANKCPLSESKLRQQFLDGVDFPDQYVVLLSYMEDTQVLTGILVARAHELSFSTKRVATEQIWFADDPRSLIYLYKTYAHWAKQIAKVDVLSCGSYLPQVNTYLKNKGMTAVESSFIQELI